MGQVKRCRYCDEPFESNTHRKYYCSPECKLMGQRLRKRRSSRKTYYKKKAETQAARF